MGQRRLLGIKRGGSYRILFFVYICSRNCLKLSDVSEDSPLKRGLTTVPDMRVPFLAGRQLSYFAVSQRSSVLVCDDSVALPEGRLSSFCFWSVFLITKLGL